MRRASAVLRALAALVALALLVVGLPAALLAFGTSPVRGGLTTQSVRDAFYEPTSDRVVAGLLTIAAWVVWGLFLRALFAEVAAARRQWSMAGADVADPASPARVGPLRWLARTLVLWSTMIAGSVGSFAGVTTAPALTSVLAIADAHPIAATPPAGSAEPSAIREPRAEVPAGERVIAAAPTDAWTMAERHLGSGSRWHELWTHNRDHVQPDGRRWTDAESTIEPGWELYLPGTVPAAAPEETPTGAAEVQIQERDNFWRLAEAHLATYWGRQPTAQETAPYWQRVIDTNRTRLAPPGDPSVIYPGQVFDLPDPGPDPTAALSAPSPSEAAATSAPAPAPEASTGPTPAEPQESSSTPTASTPAAPAMPEARPEARPPTQSTEPETDEQGAADRLIDQAWPVGLAGGGVTLAGVVLLLDRRRRAQQRHRPIGRRLPVPASDIERTEGRLRAGVDVDGGQLVDVALRAAAAGAGTTGLPTLRWVEADGDSVLLVLVADCAPPRGFVADGPDRWRSAAPVDDLARLADGTASPTPALVPVGSSQDGGEVLVDVEASGVVTVSGPEEVTASFLRGLAVAAATVPWNDQGDVVLAGLLGELDVLPRVTTATSLGDALANAESHADRTAATLKELGCVTAGQGRRSGEAPDAWEPLVVISAEEPGRLDERRLAGLAARPLHAVGVVTPAGAAPAQGRAFTLDDDGLLRIDGVDPVLRASLLPEPDTQVVMDILESAVPLAQAVPTSEVADQAVRGVARSDRPTKAVEPTGSRLHELLADVDVLVRVLGEIEVVRLTADGEEPLASERQKGLEAVVYMALRESAVDREDLEAALFPNGANAAKTFHNSVSAARGTVGEALLPHSSSGHYELSDRVVTDYGLFCDLVAEADETDDADRAAALLRDALGLVRGEPFTGVGRGYCWVSSHRGMIVAQVVDAAEELAEVCLATEDWRAAEWAARQGLAAFPCDERMYRLLMRTSKAAGNTPGVTRAFRELCDAVADPDDGVEPVDTVHPDTVALLEQLTRPDHQRMGA